MEYLLPTGVNLQCTECGVPIEVISALEWPGENSVSVLAEPCGHRPVFTDILTRNYVTLLEEVARG